MLLNSIQSNSRRNSRGQSVMHAVLIPVLYNLQVRRAAGAHRQPAGCQCLLLLGQTQLIKRQSHASSYHFSSDLRWPSFNRHGILYFTI